MFTQTSGNGNLAPGGKTPGKVPKQKGSSAAGLPRLAVPGQLGAHQTGSLAATGAG